MRMRQSAVVSAASSAVADKNASTVACSSKLNVFPSLLPTLRSLTTRPLRIKALSSTMIARIALLSSSTGSAIASVVSLSTGASSPCVAVTASATRGTASSFSRKVILPGSAKRNSVPEAADVSTVCTVVSCSQTSPPMACANWRHDTRPRPTPRWSPVLTSSSKRRSATFGGTPRPVSVTANTRQSVSWEPPGDDAALGAFLPSSERGEPVVRSIDDEPPTQGGNFFWSVVSFDLDDDNDAVRDDQPRLREPPPLRRDDDSAEARGRVSAAKMPLKVRSTRPLRVCLRALDRRLLARWEKMKRSSLTAASRPS
mmetsp:Transcript_8221/g.25398  ORF Transcript_8221/g.25398 Transcript_8221/m.25398 type:complete len:314 (+) Transcript_8221:441-1382(+)